MINKIKAHGPVLEDLLDDISQLIDQRAENNDMTYTEQRRNLALGKTNLQQGFMWLIRTVTAPNGLS